MHWLRELKEKLRIFLLKKIANGSAVAMNLELKDTIKAKLSNKQVYLINIKAPISVITGVEFCIIRASGCHIVNPSNGKD